MFWGKLATSLLLAATAVEARRSLAHAGPRIQERAERLYERRQSTQPREQQQPRERAVADPLFLTANTTKFAIDGTKIPDVDFDIGESYAGLLPISSDPDDPNKLYWWFFPSTNPSSEKEILIWLNGGPGCSSLEGLLQENGPFLWQYGTFKPFANPWSWNKLVHTVWVEQPIGTGFTQGTPTATSEEDVAKQFMGFWKNFVDTFAVQGYKVYIAGESYAGMFVPYITNGFLEAEDTTYYDASGILIYDPSIHYDAIMENIPAVGFANYWGGLFPFNDTFRATLQEKNKACGYAAYLDKYLVYPPAGLQPSDLPGDSDECSSIWEDIADAALIVNPCFDIYQVATTCPVLWDVLGFPGSFDYLPPGASIYFDRADVKAAINAPNTSWSECMGPVFVGEGDTSLPSSLTVLPNVIDKTKNVIIGHGALDMILLANGTLLSIQNMTFGGKLGFQTKPIEPFYVPYHDEDPTDQTLAASGVFGTAHTERGLTYVGTDLSGHMVPQYAPSAAFRQLEFLLGRIDSLSSTVPFTTDESMAQSTQPLGLGTAPQGWSNGGGTCKSRKRSAKMRDLP